MDGFQLSSLILKYIKYLKSDETIDLIKYLTGRFDDLLKDNKKLQYLRHKGEINHWQLHWKQKTTHNS